MCDKSKVLNECLQNHALEYPDKPVDIFDLISKYTLDIICETAMGVEIDAQRKTTDAYFKAVHEYSLNIIIDGLCVHYCKNILHNFPILQIF